MANLKAGPARIRPAAVIANSRELKKAKAVNAEL